MLSNAGFRRTLLMGSIPLIAVLLIVAASLNYIWARSTLEREAREGLDQEWAAMNGYLRIEYDASTQMVADQWYYDRDDADEAAVVSRIRERCLIADENGRVLHEPSAYRDAGIEQIGGRIREALRSPEAGRAIWITRKTSQGLSYLIRASTVLDERGRSPYYVAIAAPVSRNRQALRTFSFSLAGVILCAFLLGWSVGRIVPQRPA